jgi:ArsR family transcriptional regulator
MRFLPHDKARMLRNRRMTVIYIDNSRYMDESGLLTILRALAHPTRLGIVNLLARASNELPAGDIAAALKVRQNTLSSHLALLTRCGLVEGQRRGRQIFYTIEMANARRSVLHLLGVIAGLSQDEADKIVSQVIGRRRKQLL